MFTIDLPLLGVAALYFCLSFAMQKVINRLPLFCSLFWPFIASWGICWTVIGYAIASTYFWPQTADIWPHVYRLAIIFIAALPGQWVAYRNQTLILAEIFRRFHINRRTTGHTIFFRELFSYETDTDNDSDLYSVPANTGNGHCSTSAAQRRINSYRKRYPN